jgi:toxin ParE1/3/4
MRLRYAPEAREHMASIYAYISAHNPSAATRVIARIREAAERLRMFPRIGRIGTAGTYERPVRGLPYVIVYEIYPDRDELMILGVFHGAQDRERRS